MAALHGKKNCVFWVLYSEFAIPKSALTALVEKTESEIFNFISIILVRYM